MHRRELPLPQTGRSVRIPLFLGFLIALYPFFTAPGAHRLGQLAGLTVPLLSLPGLSPAAAQALVWLLLLLALAGLLGARQRPLLPPLLLGYFYFLCLDYRAWWGLSAPLLALGVALLAGAGRRPLRLLWLAAAGLAALECSGVGPLMLVQLVALALPWRWPALGALIFQSLCIEGSEYGLFMSAWLFELDRMEGDGGWPGLALGLAVLLSAGVSLPPGVEYVRLSFVREGRPQELILQHPRESHSSVEMTPTDLLPVQVLRTRARTLRDGRFYDALGRALARRLGVPVTVEKSAHPPPS